MFRVLVLAASLGVLSCGNAPPNPQGSAAFPVPLPARDNRFATPASRDEPALDAAARNQQSPAATNAFAPELTTVTLSGISITAVAFDSRSHRLAVADQPGGPGSRWPDAKAAATSMGGLAALNAGFFTPEGGPLGLVVADGERAGSMNRASSLGAGLYTDAGSPALVRREKGSSAPTILQSGPFLVEGGRRIAGLSPESSSARSIIGWDGGTGWFIARTGACSLADLGSALAGGRIGGVEARAVLNLDGGRSSDLWVSPALPGGPVEQRPFWNKPVRNFLVLLPRQ